jgi:biopolymer transport protein ExbB
MESLFLKGGIFMWPLFITLLITLVITLERWLYWIKSNYTNNLNLRSLLTDDNSNKVLLEGWKGEREDSAIVLAYNALLRKNLTTTEIDNIAKRLHITHQRYMRLLDVITSVAPLLGILGTIWGIISSFDLAGNVKELEPSVAMIGMSEAFITTAFGLIVSLVALFAFNYFQSLSEKEMVSRDIFLSRLLVRLERDD